MLKNKQRGRLNKLAAIALLPIFILSAFYYLPAADIKGADIALVSASFLFPEGVFSLLSRQSQKNTETYVAGENSPDNVEEGELEVTSGAQSAASAPSSQAPVADGDKGTILEQNMAVANTAATGNIIALTKGTLKNYTSLTTAQIAPIISSPPDFTISKGKEIQVLIMHTHATESYEMSDLGYYLLNSASRSNDLSLNMAKVGEAIKNELTAGGIGVIHDTTLHDYPSYTNSYARSAATVKSYLSKYPTIKVVLDVHRDAIQRTDGVRIKPTAVIGGKKAAQVMIISGCDNGKLNMPKWASNLKFAALLNSTMETMFPGLTRPVMLDYRKYNQDLTTGSLLLEFGSHANTLDEAVYSGQMVGKSLCAALKSISK